MLYNPEWEVEVKADPFSTVSLIAWLEKQPADRAYDYCYPDTCVIAQYLQSQGVEQYTIDDRELDKLGWHNIAQHRDYEIGETQDWTFGGALKRARAAMSR
jgi:hypothetical protein